MSILTEFFSKKELESLQSIVIDEIEDLFEDAIEELKAKGLPAKYTSFINKDGTIDAELRITHIPRTMRIRDSLTALENSFPDKIIADTWVSTGVLFNPKSDDNPYDKLEGYNFINVTYQNSSRYHHNISNMRDYALDNIQKANRGVIKQVLFRIHWNGMVEKPKR